MLRIVVCLLAGLAISTDLSSQGFTELAQSLGLDFDYGSGEYGGGVSFVDFNQDGLDDLTYAQGNNRLIRFFQNNGNGFTELPALIPNTEEIKQVLWVDFNNDGLLDLFLASHNENQLFKNTGDLNLVNITETCGFNDPSSISFCGTWIDYDEDALMDLCISHRSSHLVGFITLYHNIGNDQFENVTAQAGLSNLGNSVLSMASLDYNNDGLEDIYVGQDYDAGNILLKNNGDGTFENVSAASGSDVDNDSMSATIGDYNGDGWMDIYVTNTSPGNSLFENQGDGTFVDVAVQKGVVLYQFTWGAVFLDADLDMDLDLFVNRISSSTNTSYMFENPGNGEAYSNVTSTWGFADDHDYSVGNAIGDYDGDNRVEIAKNNSNSYENTFWRNDFTENNWLTVDLVGVMSNSMAVGAVVDVYAGGIHQIRRVGVGEGFSSQNSYTQYFGLGQNEMVDIITVTWPNGLVTTTLDVPADTALILYEVPPTCSDPLACNFDSQFVSENTSTCSYPGCDNQSAANYNSEAGCDDGSCLFYASECPGDFNFDNQVNVADLLILLGGYGLGCND
jgi:hypothetical protein